MQGEELLRVESICFTDGSGATCRDVSFSLARGENLVIFGPEGSGAEVVCPLIAGTVISFEGDIFFKGRSVESYDYFERHTYRKELGYLQRSYGLINNMSAEENIALPLRYHSRMTSTEIDAHIDRLINELGLGHCRGLRPVALSGSIRTCSSSSTRWRASACSIPSRSCGRSAVGARAMTAPSSSSPTNRRGSSIWRTVSSCCTRETSCSRAPARTLSSGGTTISTSTCVRRLTGP